MLTNYVFKLRPNIHQADNMSEWLNMLRSSYNWSLADRIAQYNHQFIQGDYCDIRSRAEACPVSNSCLSNQTSK
ncbi:helix-turn-helix domain-containing protein [Nostoc sp. CCCryo 231-06]|nr:helix-turn-helix domain-containing protein [Nostoc sp. CCCryo 231-06]